MAGAIVWVVLAAVLLLCAMLAAYRDVFTSHCRVTFNEVYLDQNTVNANSF